MIVLNVIVRNAEDTIVDALDSVKAAVDYFVIGFAGESEDSTREVVMNWLQSNAAGAFSVLDFEFVDFADARNKVLAANPPEAEWMLWMDADDTIKDAAAIREVVKTATAEDGAFQFPYIYQTDDNGNVMVMHDRERLIRLSLGWQWKRPVHETLSTDKMHRIVRLKDATWIHNWKSNQDSRHERNKKLLFDYLEREPSDLRTKLYIAHSFYSAEDWLEAANWFVQYYNEPENILEQWQAAVFAGDSFFALSQFEMSIGWYMQAIQAMPNYADPYIGIGSCYTKMGEFDKAVYWFREADKDRELPPSFLFILPNRYTYNRWANEHYALAGTGDTKGALQVALAGLKHTKYKHDGFAYYAYLYEESINREKAVDAAKHLVYYMQQRGDALAAMEVLNHMPRPLYEMEEFEKLQQSAYEAVEHLFKPDEDIYDGEKYIAGRGARVYEQKPERMERVQQVFDILERAASEKDGDEFSVVDIGGGDGLIGIRMVELYGWNVTVIDQNGYNIELAKQYAEERGVADKMRFLVGNTSSLTEEEVGMHDAAVCMEVIEHVIDPAMIVTFGMNVAERLIVTTPHQEVGIELANTPDGKHLHHVREFDFGMLMRMSAGLGYGVRTLKTALSKGNVLPGYGNWVLELEQDMAEKMPVVFYVGPAAENWTPDQINEEGIGGSETAVVEMARKFRENGHPVFVYGPVDGVWDGVFYRKFKYFDPSGPAAGAGALLFVSSRVPEVFDAPVNAAVKWLWTHDNTYNDRLTPERVEEINAILVLSEWHKKSFEEQYPFAADKLLVTGNGIDPARFEELDFSERDPHKFVWSSSFDRGLDKVLDMWPKIRAMWPDATLDVYYGFDLADKIYGTRNPYWNAFREKIADGLEQDGVTYYGRTPQKDMPAAFAKASFWLYPTAFQETYCITALETQAAGVIPVVSNAGALPERVPSETWPVVTPHELDGAYVEALEMIDASEDLRAGLREYALRFTWDKVFQQWKKAIGKYAEENIRARRLAQVAENGTTNENP